MFKNFFNRLTKKSQEITETESFKNLADKVEDFTDATVEKTKDVIEDIKENEAVKNAIEKTKEVISDLQENEAVKNAVKKTKEAANAVADKTKEVFHDIQENEAVKNAVEKTKEYGETIVDKVKETTGVGKTPEGDVFHTKSPGSDSEEE